MPNIYWTLTAPAMVAALSMSSSIARAQSIELTNVERGSAGNCLIAYKSAEQQTECFRTLGLLKDGRTPEQIREYVTEYRAKQQAALELKIKQQDEAAALKRKQQAEAEARERAECAKRNELPPAEVALVAKQQIQLGMSRAALLCSWGQPNRDNRTVGSWGVHEQFVYEYGRYVYVENGKVTSWQD